MQGEPWIDEAMKSIAGYLEKPGEYNRVYEALIRGTERQGRSLLAALANAFARAALAREGSED